MSMPSGVDHVSCWLGIDRHHARTWGMIETVFRCVRLRAREIGRLFGLKKKSKKVALLSKIHPSDVYAYVAPIDYLKQGASMGAALLVAVVSLVIGNGAVPGVVITGEVGLR